MDGQTDKWMERQKDRGTDGMDGQMNGLAERWTNGQTINQTIKQRPYLYKDNKIRFIIFQI